MLCMFGAYVCTYYSLDTNIWWLIWPSIVQGFGFGLIFVPLAATAFATLPPRLRAEAAGFNSLMRTVGASIGIAITLTVFTRHTQISWNQLVGFISPYNPNLGQYLQQTGWQITNPSVPGLLGNELAKQAAMLSIVNVFVFITRSFLVLLPLVFLLKYTKHADPSIKHVNLE